MYNFLTTSNEVGIYQRRRKLKCSIDPFVFTTLIIILFCIVSMMIYIFVLLTPILHNFDHLITTTIPNELDFYHNMTLHHNQTISKIEKYMIEYLNSTNIILNQNTLDNANVIVENIKEISTNLNISEIQFNLNQIVMILNKILPHYA